MEAAELAPNPEANEEDLKDTTMSLSYSSNGSPTDISLLPTSSSTQEEDDKKMQLVAPVTPTPEMSALVRTVIGPTCLMEAVACPCCNQVQDETQAETLNEPACIARSRGSLLASESEDEEEEEDDERYYDEDLLPGTLETGVKYHARQVLVEGWVHKKGTGKDWLGSKSWKPRWARLITARVEGYECSVPLLQIYWHPSAPVPSTVILLESTVVLAVDLEDKERWNSFRFEIRHASTRENATIPVTRTFTLPKKGRDAWVYAISEALLAYAKEKDQIKKTAVMDALDSDGCIKSTKKYDCPKSPRFDEVWTGDRFVTVEVRKALSPPSSPPSAYDRSRNHRAFPSPPTSPRLPRPGAGSNRAIRRPIVPREATSPVDDGTPPVMPAV